MSRSLRLSSASEAVNDRERCVQLLVFGATNRAQYGELRPSSVTASIPMHCGAQALRGDRNSYHWKRPIHDGRDACCREHGQVINNSW